MNFEWDDEKNTANIRKHGLDFADAWKVFASPSLEELDDRDDYGETRWSALGILDDRIVKVIFTEPAENTIRIISLRRAIKYEREQFEHAFKNRLGSGRRHDR